MAELAIHGSMIEFRGLMTEYLGGGKITSFLGLIGGLVVHSSDSAAGDPEYPSQVPSESTGEYHVGDALDVLAGESSFRLSLDSRAS